jgi:hypothetical protein
LVVKTNIESVSAVEKRIRVEVPANEVSRRVEKGYAEVRKMTPLRGFRKGKAPMSMVRRVFKESVEADVAEHLVRDSLAEAVKENDLKILSLPKVDGAKLAEGQEFVFTATVEVVPEVTPEGYKGISMVKERVGAPPGPTWSNSGSPRPRRGRRSRKTTPRASSSRGGSPSERSSSRTWRGPARGRRRRSRRSSRRISPTGSTPGSGWRLR